MKQSRAKNEKYLQIKKKNFDLTFGLQFVNFFYIKILKTNIKVHKLATYLNYKTKNNIVTFFTPYIYKCSICFEIK